MNNINCDIIRDLLPSYLDGICSEASSELIEEHLKTCPGCGQVMYSMKTAVPGAGAMSEAVAAQKASALVKIRKWMGLNKLSSGALFFVSVGLCLFFLNRYAHITPTLYYYLLPPVLFGSYLILGTAPASVSGFRRSPLLCIAGLLSMPCGLLAMLSVYQWVDREVFLNIPVNQCGHYIEGALLALIAADCALLAALLWIHARKSVLFLPLLTGSITGIFMLLAYRHLLYYMESSEEYMLTLLTHTLILLAEGTAFYILILLKQHFFDRKTDTDYNEVTSNNP